MTLDFSVLQPEEFVILLVAVGGLLPVVLYRERLPTWLMLPYLFFFLGAVLTNVENFVWHDFLNFLEHSVANLGAGLTMALAAYLGYRTFDPEPQPRKAVD